MSLENRGVRVHPAFMGLLLALIVVLSGTLFLRANGLTVSFGSATSPSPQSTAGQPSGKQLYYSTMHPWIVQDHPGTCPICGMELVKMSADQQAEWQKNHKAA